MPDKKSDSPADTSSTTDNNQTGDQTTHNDTETASMYDRGTPEALRRAIDKLQGTHKEPNALPESSTNHYSIIHPTTSALKKDDNADSPSEDLPSTETDEAHPDDTTDTTDTDESTRELHINVSASEAGADEAAILNSWDSPAADDTDSDVPDAESDITASTDEANDLVPAAAANMEQPEKQLQQADHTPWTLQQFFNGEIDLDVELSKRFPNMPMMTSVKFRNLGNKKGRRVATTTTQDGSSSLVIDADMETKAIQLSFTYGSMMTLRYSLINLNDIDRSRWLELMNRDQGGLAFLWGPSRWQDDYLICIGRKYFTNLYAFSPNQFESAVRMSPGVISDLLEWLDDIWHTEPDDDSDDDDTQLLTW
jgi:hypothetical protein